LWEQISSPSIKVNGGADLVPPNRWEAMGPAARQTAYVPWATEVSTFRCPNDPGVGLPALGRTNYAACHGDAIDSSQDAAYRCSGSPCTWGINQTYALHVRAAMRGAFVFRTKVGFRDFLDGTSNTIACGEIATDLGDSSITTKPNIVADDRLNNVVRGGLYEDPTLADANVDPLRPRFWCPAASTTCTPGTYITGASSFRGYR